MTRHSLVVDALGLGVGMIALFLSYLLANVLFLYALLPETLSQQPALADAAMTALFSHHVGRWVSLFMGIISFGAALCRGARRRTNLLQHGARWHVLCGNEQDTSALEYPGHCAALAMRLGHRPDYQRALCAALQMQHFFL